MGLNYEYVHPTFKLKSFVGDINNL